MSFYDSDDEDATEVEDQETLHTPPADGDKSCPICLNNFGDQQIGVPNSCEHVYCIDCILQWTKKTSTCPLDRIKIQHLCVYKSYGGPFSCEIKVKETIREELINPLSIVSCEICGSGDNEDTLLLCDGCDKGYHCACLTPPLSEVPSSEWFCDHCMLQFPPAETVSSSTTRPRRVGRTSITEQIRNEITRNRSSIRTLDIGARNEFDAIIESVLRGASRHVEVTKKRKRRKSSRKRGRGVKKSRKEKQNLSSGPADRCSGLISAPQLSLRGERNVLYDFETSPKTQDAQADHIIAKKHRMLSRSAIRFNAPLPSLLLPSLGVATPPPLPPPNLLETIFNDQDLLVAPASQVTIASNGSWKRRHGNAKTRQSASSDQPESSSTSGSSSAPKSSSSAPSGSSSTVSGSSSTPGSSLSVPDSSSSTNSSNQNLSNTLNGSQSISNNLSSITKDQSNLYDPFQPTLSDEDELCGDSFSCNNQQFKNQNISKNKENQIFKDEDQICKDEDDQIDKDEDTENQICKDEDADDQISKDEDTENQICKDEDVEDQISKDEDTENQICKDEDADDQISKDEDTSDQISKDEDADDQISKDEDTENQICKDEDANHQISKDEDVDDQISKDEDVEDQISKDEDTNDQISKEKDAEDQISKDEDANDQISKDEDAKDQIPRDEDQVFKEVFCKRSEKVEEKTKNESLNNNGKNKTSNSKHDDVTNSKHDDVTNNKRDDVTKNKRNDVTNSKRDDVTNNKRDDVTNNKRDDVTNSKRDDVTNSKRDDVKSKKSHSKKKAMKRKTSRSRDRTRTSRSKSRDRHERRSSRSVSRDRRRDRNRSREDAKRSGKRKRRSRSVSSSSRDRKKYKSDEKSKKKQKKHQDDKNRSRKKKEAVMTSEPSVDDMLEEAFESKVTSSPRVSNKKEEKKQKRATSQSSDENRRRRRSHSSNSNSSRRRRKRSSRRRSTSRDRSYYNRRSSRKRRDSPRINNRSRHRRSSPMTSLKTASIDPAFFRALEKSKITSEQSIAPIADVTSPKPITTLTGVASNDVKSATSYLFHDEADRGLNDVTDVPSMSSAVRSALIEIPVVDSIAPATSSTRNDRKVKSDENGKKLADDVTAAISRKSKDAISNILNIAGVKPINAGGTRATIMSIAELTKQLDLPPLLTSGTNTLLKKFTESDSNKEADGLSPVSIDNIESSAVDMYNRGKQRQLLKKKEFQAAVVEAAKVAIKPSYENREISKAQYKDIMKKAVNKVCQADKTMEVNPIKIRRLIRRYVDIHKSKNEKHKEKMRNELDHQRGSKRRSSGSRKKSKKQQPITEAVSPSSNQSLNLQSTTLEDTKQPAAPPADPTIVVDGLSLLKRQPRKIVTLPDLPLPPPPPPPRPSGYKL